MSSRIREALCELEHDVAGLRLASPQSIRARGQAQRRRQTVALASVAAGVVAAGAVALPSLYHGWRGSDGRTGHTLAGSIPRDRSNAGAASGCASPVASPTLSDAARAGAIARSRNATVFLKPTASPAEKAAVETKLNQLSTVIAIDFLSHEQQFERFAAQFCYAPAVVAATKPENLPEAFELTLANPGDYVAVQTTIKSMAGVEDVVHDLG
jgi:FtsX extracellular domain